MAAVSCQCDTCGETLEVPAGYREFTVVCRTCMHVVAVPRSAAPPPPPAEPTAIPEVPPEEVVTSMRRRCHRHGNLAARWQCERCRYFLCNSCANVRDSGHVKFAVCSCSGRLVPHRFEDAGSHRRDMWRALGESFEFPVRGSGLAVIAVAALLPLLVALLASLPMVGALVWVACWLVGPLVYFAFGLHVILRTVEDPKADLDWPDVQSIGDLLGPVLKIACSTALFLGPSLLLAGRGAAWPWVVAAVAVGGFFWPMALLGAAILEHLQGLSPLHVLQSILRVPHDYTRVVASFYLACGLLAVALWMAGWIPVLGAGLAFGSMIYFTAVQARMLGHLFRANQERLGWF